MDERRWLPFRLERPHARACLVCLPFAAGSAQTYRTWSTLLPDVDVCAVELPGRGTRFADPIVDDAPRLIAALVEVLGGLVRPDRPLVVLGHSLGGRIGFALARAGLPMRALVVSGSRPPSMKPVIHEGPLDDERLVLRLRELGGTPPEVFEHPELLELFLPIVRADAELDRALASEATIDVPIVAVGSRDDNAVAYADLERWRAHTTASFALEPIAASTHFFVTTHAAELARIALRLALA